MRNIYYHIILILSATLLVACSLYEDESDGKEGFIKLFGKSGLDAGVDLNLNSADQVFLLGNFVDTINDEDMLLLNLDTKGNALWSKQIGDTIIQNATQIEIAASGSFYVVGYQEVIYAEDNSNTQVSVSYHNPDGSLVWTKFFGNSNREESVSADLTEAGDLIIAGDVWIKDETSQEEDADFFIMKINANGDSLWYRQYGGSELDRVSQVRVYNNQSYVLGSSRSFGDMGQLLSNVLLLSVNEAGIINDKATYGGANNEVGNAIIAFESNSFLLLYTTYLQGEASGRIGILKISTSIQNIIFDKVVTVPAGHTGVDLLQKNDNDFYILTNSGSSTEQDIRMICCNQLADTLWTLSYGSETSEEAVAFRKNSNGDIYIAGTTGFKGNSMIMLIKVDAEGKFN